MAITSGIAVWWTRLAVALSALQLANGAPAPSVAWVALGDSYAAGPGAGEGTEFWDGQNCYRNKLSYPAQLHASFAAGQPSNDLQFLACSGAVSAAGPTGEPPAGDKLLANQIERMRADAQLVTLSIGGNDVGFVDVLKDCVYLNGKDCAAQQRQARAKIEGLPAALRAAWDKIFEKLPAGDDSRKVYQTLYGRFFNAGSEWCNNQRMDPLNVLNSPLITQKLRQDTNALGLLLNEKIKRTMFDYAQEKLRSGTWKVNRIAFLDPDQPVYEGHRFCEPSHQNFWNESIAFFNAFRRDSPTGGFVEAGIERRDPLGELLEPAFKTFHPKSWTHGEIAKGVRQAIERSAAMASQPGAKPLRMENMDAWGLEFHW